MHEDYRILGGVYITIKYLTEGRCILDATYTYPYEILYFTVSNTLTCYSVLRNTTRHNSFRLYVLLYMFTIFNNRIHDIRN